MVLILVILTRGFNDEKLTKFTQFDGLTVEKLIRFKRPLLGKDYILSQNWWLHFLSGFNYHLHKQTFVCNSYAL